MWRRFEHTAGNAAAWDARRDELRVYHRDWLACFAALPDAAVCADAAAGGGNSTEGAVAARECAEARGLALTGTAMGNCLSTRGHPEPRLPRWTRDDFGLRFEGPYVTLSALFAEDFGLPPPVARSLGWWRGVVAPIGLVGLALYLLSRGGRPPRDGGPAGP